LWLHFHIQLHQIITLQHNTMHIGPLFLGTLQMEPATNWFDESFATILKSHERFARQQRSRPSITYHVTSASSRIDHQLSGIKNIVLMHGSSQPRKDTCRLVHFHSEALDPPRTSYYILKLLDSCFKTRRTAQWTRRRQMCNLWSSFAEGGPGSGKAQGYP